MSFFSRPKSPERAASPFTAPPRQSSPEGAEHQARLEHRRRVTKRISTRQGNDAMWDLYREHLLRAAPADDDYASSVGATLTDAIFDAVGLHAALERCPLGLSDADLATSVLYERAVDGVAQLWAGASAVRPATSDERERLRVLLTAFLSGLHGRVADGARPTPVSRAFGGELVVGRVAAEVVAAVDVVFAKGYERSGTTVTMRQRMVETGSTSGHIMLGFPAASCAAVPAVLWAAYSLAVAAEQLAQNLDGEQDRRQTAAAWAGLAATFEDCYLTLGTTDQSSESRLDASVRQLLRAAGQTANAAMPMRRRAEVRSTVADLIR